MAISHEGSHGFVPYDKLKALDMSMRYLGQYERDNLQRDESRNITLNIALVRAPQRDADGNIIGDAGGKVIEAHRRRDPPAGSSVSRRLETHAEDLRGGGGAYDHVDQFDDKRTAAAPVVQAQRAPMPVEAAEDHLLAEPPTVNPADPQPFTGSNP
jgi:hypothetical protein